MSIMTPQQRPCRNSCGRANYSLEKYLGTNTAIWSCQGSMPPVNSDHVSAVQTEVEQNRQQVRSRKTFIPNQFGPEKVCNWPTAPVFCTNRLRPVSRMSSGELFAKFGWLKTQTRKSRDYDFTLPIQGSGRVAQRHQLVSAVPRYPRITLPSGATRRVRPISEYVHSARAGNIPHRNAEPRWWGGPEYR